MLFFTVRPLTWRAEKAVGRFRNRRNHKPSVNWLRGPKGGTLPPAYFFVPAVEVAEESDIGRFGLADGRHISNLVIQFAMGGTPTLSLVRFFQIFRYMVLNKRSEVTI